MAQQIGNAIWLGDLKKGEGNISTESGALNIPYSFKTRFEDDTNGTTPEELIGAAHAGCYSMYLSSLLAKAGHPVNHIRTQATVHLEVTDNGPFISKIDLVTEADVPDLKEIDFLKYAEEAKDNCPVSKALSGVPDINLKAALK